MGGAGWVDVISFHDDTAQDVSFVVPQHADGRDIHIMLRVVDDDAPVLATWRRVTVRVAKRWGEDCPLTVHSHVLHVPSGMNCMG